MKDSKTPNTLNQSLVMGALVAITSVSILTIMNMF